MKNRIIFCSLFAALLSTSALADGSTVTRTLEGTQAKALYQALTWAGLAVDSRYSSKNGVDTLNVRASHLHCHGVVEGVTADLLATGHCSLGSQNPPNLQITASAIPIVNALSAAGVFVEGGMSQYNVNAEKISCTAFATDSVKYVCNVTADFSQP